MRNLPGNKAVLLDNTLLKDLDTAYTIFSRLASLAQEGEEWAFMLERFSGVLRLLEEFTKTSGALGRPVPSRIKMLLRELYSKLSSKDLPGFASTLTLLEREVRLLYLAGKGVKTSIVVARLLAAFALSGAIIFHLSTMTSLSPLIILTALVAIALAFSSSLAFYIEQGVLTLTLALLLSAVIVAYGEGSALVYIAYLVAALAYYVVIYVAIRMSKIFPS